MPRPSRLLPRTFLATLFVVFAGSSAGAQAVLFQNFTGSVRGIDTGFIPPDTMGAVGPNHYVELINGRYSAYRKTDGVRVQTSSLDQFFLNGGLASINPTSSFDPRVMFDASSGRWFACAVDGARTALSSFLIAVSLTNDPTAGWRSFRVDADTDNVEWADFPTMGFSTDKVVLTANMFPIAAGSTTVTVLTIPKASLTAGVPSIAGFTIIENTNPNNTGFTPSPTQDPQGASADVRLLSAFNSGSGSLKFSSLTGAPAGPAFTTAGGFVTVPAFSAPPTAPQPAIGGAQKANINTGDTRFSGPVYRVGGSIWATDSSSIAGRSAIQWYQFDANTFAVLRAGSVSHPTLSLYFPSISANTSGDVVIGCSGSSSTQPVSTYAFVGRAASATVFFSDPVLLKAGLDDYQALDGSSRNRWGDYSSVSPDPSDANRFWAIQEWVSANDIYSTQVTCVRVCPADFDRSGTRLPADIFAFLNAYFASDPRTDFDNNNALQPADIFAFLNNYFLGCS